MRLFRRQGYAGTGLQQILAESGAPKGSLYHFFPDGKEALAEAAVELAGDMIGEMLTAHAARHPADPGRFVEAYGNTLAQWMEESGFRSGCPIATTLLETTPGSEPMRRRGQAVFDGWIDIIAGVYRNSGMHKAQALGRAQSLIAAMEGALILARVRRSTTPIRAVVRTFQSLATARPDGKPAGSRSTGRPTRPQSRYRN
jgi:TetR/AcrR family transcriptional regulator, lmrAB and yxaGH operons repressor